MAATRSQTSPARTPATTARRLLALVALVLGILAGSASFASAALTTDVALTKAETGTAPFEAPDAGEVGPGRDKDADNDQVRSYDTIKYAWSVNVNESTSQQGTFDKVTFVQTLPDGLTWRTNDVPAYCKGPGWSVTAQKLTCVYVPAGGVGQTGSTLNFELMAQADGRPDGFVATPDPGSVSVTASKGETTSAPSETEAPPVTIRSAPYLDMVKAWPNAEKVAAKDGRPAGFVIDYPVQLRVPADRQATFGRRGMILPVAPVSFTDDFSLVSPNAVFDSCDDVTCDTVPGQAQQRRITFTSFRSDAPRTDGLIAEGRVRIFVPASDVPADPGTIETRNTLVDLDAKAPTAGGGTTATVGDIVANNTQKYQLIAVGGEGNLGFRKYFRNATGGLLANQYDTGDGNAQVVPGQVVLSSLDVSNDNNTAEVPGVVLCDVWDNTRVNLSADGPGPTAHGGKLVWPEQSLADWDEGSDYVVEYGVQATATGDDEAIWTALRGRSDCSAAGTTWQTTPPANLSTVSKIRVTLNKPFPATTWSGSFRINMKVAANVGDDQTIGNFLGHKVGTADWVASKYRPASHGDWGSGDRLHVNGVTVALEKRAIEPLASPVGSPVAIVSGGGVQFQLKPRITTLNGALADQRATNVVIKDRLPLGMTLDTSKPTGPDGLTPTVTVDPEGRQVLTWNVGTLNGDDDLKLTYWVKTASTKVGTLVNDAIVDSTEDSGGLSEFPSTGARNQHFSRQTVNLQSPGGVQISKSTDQLFVEPEDALRYQVTYANLTANPVDGVDVIDVLPFVGDGDAAGGTVGRSPASAFHGRALLDRIEVSDGETVRYTDAAPTAVFAAIDPSRTTGYGPLPAGKQWCTEAQLGDPGCPVKLEDATAFRVTRTTALPTGQDVTVKVHLQPRGNRSQDLYSNTSAIRYTGGALGAISNIATIRVVASSIGDYVWEDTDKDGIQDANERPLANVLVTLAGTDKHGRKIALQTRTDKNGKYLFTSSTQDGQDAGVLDLVSGQYTVTFHRDGLPTGTTFTTRNSSGSTAENDSDADQQTGSTREFTLPDPSPTGLDGQDLTWDAGIVIGPGDPPVPPNPEPPTTPEPPKPPEPPVPPTPEQPRERTVEPARLTVKKTSSLRTVAAGRTLKYRLTVRNSGKGEAVDVRICDVLPRGLTLVTRGKGTLRGGKLCWTVKRLAPGASVTRSFTARIDRSVRPGSLVNHATVEAAGVKGVSASRKVKVKRAAPKQVAKPYVTG